MDNINALNFIVEVLGDKVDLTIPKLDNFEAKELFENLRSEDQFNSFVVMYLAGRAGAGKSTTINNFLEGIQKQVKVGAMDTTEMLQFITLKSNLIVFDPPGSEGNRKLENINRIIFGMPQRTNTERRSKSEVVNEFEIFNMADGSVKTVSIEDWSSHEYQQNIKPDVILYIVAPDKQFTDGDDNYCYELLKVQKDKGLQSNVLFLLNLWDDKDPQELCDYIRIVKKKITTLYQEIYSSGDFPDFFEVNCKHGTGFDKVVSHVCKILPSEKLGKIEDVLLKDFKDHAKSEQLKRYRDGVYHIVSLASSYPIDKQVSLSSIAQDNFSLLETAAFAIGQYATSLFKNGSFLEYYNLFAINTIERAKEKLIVQMDAVEVPCDKSGDVCSDDTAVKDKREFWDFAWKHGWKSAWEAIKIGLDIDDEDEYDRAKQREYQAKKYWLEVRTKKVNLTVGTTFRKSGYEIVELLVGLSLGVEKFVRLVEFEDFANLNDIELDSFLVDGLQCASEKLAPHRDTIQKLTEEIKPTAKTKLVNLLTIILADIEFI